MKWLKQNLLLVVGGLGALGLLGFAGYFLYDKIQQKTAVTDQLSAGTAELERLLKREVFPSEENIKAAQVEQKRLLASLQTVKNYFPPVSKDTNSLEGASFKAFLETSIHNFTIDAERLGVSLPPKPYHFSFAAQRPLVNFASGSIDPLTDQVTDIKAILGCLYKAKIHSLVGLRRASVSSDDPAGSLDYLTKKISTNALTGAVIAPYEVTFQCFSVELAAALSLLATAPETMVITNINVSLSSASTTADGSAETPAYSMPMAGARMGGMDPAIAARYGMGRGMNQAMMSRYGLNSGGAAAAPTEGQPTSNSTPAPKTGTQTVVDEKSLKVTLMIHSIRLNLPSVDKVEKKAPKPSPGQDAEAAPATQ